MSTDACRTMYHYILIRVHHSLFVITILDDWGWVTISNYNNNADYIKKLYFKLFKNAFCSNMSLLGLP